MGGDSFDYKFGNKSNWRRWAWNRIAERVGCPSQSVVLYLAGESDLDRPIAICKGFRHENLIAVERDAEALSILRAKGVLCIEGDIKDVLHGWPNDSLRRISVVIADFCGGLDIFWIKLLSMLYLHRSFNNTVFCLNMLRGRDAGSNDLRAGFREFINANHVRFNCSSDRHRALICALASYWFLINDAQKSALQSSADPSSLEEQFGFFQRLLKWSNPVPNTYRSESGQVFDSVILTAPWLLYVMASEDYRSGMDIPSLLSNPAVCKKTSETLKSQRRKTAAILAHRTMRLQAR